MRPTAHRKRLVSLSIIATISLLLSILILTHQRSLSNRPNRKLRRFGKYLDNQIIAVESGGIFTERIKQFNLALQTTRHQIVLKRGGLNEVWRNEILTNNTRVIDGAIDNFMNELKECPHIWTIGLLWQKKSAKPGVEQWSSLTDSSNVLYQVYYEWTADDTLCKWIETPGTIKLRFDTHFNYSCNRNMNDTVKPRSLETIYLNSKTLYPNQYWPNQGNSYPAHFYSHPPSYVTYMFIHIDAVVTSFGNVFSKKCKLVQYACGHDLSNALPGNIDQLTLYDEVFVISHYWGSSVFHRMVEIMPRVALHLDFLRTNPQVRIAAVEGDGGRLAQLLQILGLNSSRLVTGHIRGKIVYHPRSTACGFANVPESQALHQKYLDYIEQHFPVQPRNRLLVIRRTGGRAFTEQKSIEEVAERLAFQYKLNFTVFGDNPTPSLNDTMQIFHSAAIVIAPHGAGLTNLFFSQRGTYVIEGVCNLPHVNLCQHRVIHILGNHWHGLTSRGGCESVIDIAATEVERALRNYLLLWHQGNNNTIG